MGNNPSYVWHSIMAAKNVVCSGSVLRIGRGESVNVWKDPWLLDSNYQRIKTPIIPGMEEIKVSSLFMIDRLDWDLDILRDLFIEDDVQQILKIPLSYSREEDTWLWLEEENGMYSMKSADFVRSTMEIQILGLHLTG